MAKKPVKHVPRVVAGWRPDSPYNRLPPLPPAVDLETRPVLKQCIAARAALAELKRAAELIPNQTMLINTLPLLEARASSEIENIVTTTDELFKFRDDSAQADPATKEALRYSYALLDAYKTLAKLPLCTRTAEQICTRIKNVAMRVRTIPGTALARENGEIVYTPPEGEDLLRNLLGNWERFLHQSPDLDPLVRLAVAHYQFEAIHPFTDGDGRTGRILNSLFLIYENLLTLPILYLSRYIIEYKPEYYRLLLAVTCDAAWEEWILFMVRGVETTAHWTMDKIEAIRRLTLHTGDFIRNSRPKLYRHEMVNLIFEKPYCRIQNLVDGGLGSRQRASRSLKQLVEIGVLQEAAVGREKLFLHPKLLRLLTRESNNFTPYK